MVIVCICGHVKECHENGTGECKNCCPAWQEQDCVVGALQNILDGRGQRQGVMIPVSASMLNFLKAHILHLEKRVQKLKLLQSGGL